MQNFTDLITAYAWTKDDDRRRQIGANIWERYGVERTVLVIDLTGFSRQAIGDEGLLIFLAVIRRMQAAARPIVLMNGGEVVKMEADNCFAVFETASDASRAAVEIVAACRAIRELEGMAIEPCCGLESGRILYLKERDFFGEAVNRATRLGEDVAGPSEVLVGAAARATLERDGWTIEDIDSRNAPAGAGRIPIR